MSVSGFQRLVADATEFTFEGWDFSVFGNRLHEQSTSWSYERLARGALDGCEAALDLGTGGGEFLAGLGSLPPRVIATEGWTPNVAVARRRLEPLGIEVVDVSAAPTVLPVPNASVDVVLSRHEQYDPGEVMRVLRSGGTFLTQQVGGKDLAGLNEALGAPPHTYASLDLAGSVADLVGSGFVVTETGEEFPEVRFADIGAVVMYLRLAPWHVEGFTPTAYEPALRRLHERMRDGAGLQAHAHRFYIVACRP